MHLRWYLCPHDNVTRDHISAKQTGHSSGGQTSGFSTSTRNRLTILPNERTLFIQVFSYSLNIIICDF